MDNGRPTRVLHAPFDVGGNAYHLARAERRYGFESSNLVYFSQWFGYPADVDLRLKPGVNPTRRPRWWKAMRQIALDVDVLHFNFGSSFLTDVSRSWVYADMPIWRRLGIATFVTFQGCDSRISSHCLDEYEINACAGCPYRSFCHDTYDTFKQERHAQLGRYFDRAFAVNPDLVHNVRNGEFLPYSNVDIKAWMPPRDFDWMHEGPVRIAHAPTSREIKGTSHIVAAVETLKEQGENVELVLIENVPHREVRAIYAQADVLLDQLLVGWYGGLAVEFMALGKPVIAYIRPGDLCHIPAEMRADLPVVSATPSTITSVLRDLVRDVERRRVLGAASRAYVERWHDPDAVARITTGWYRRALARRGPRLSRDRRAKILKTSFLPLMRTMAHGHARSSIPGRVLIKVRNRLRGGKSGVES